MKSTESILNDDHFKLLAFLITSARGCVGEPPLYGPLRLVDAAARLVEIMKKEGKAIPEIIELQKLIEEKKDLVMYDEEEFIKFLDDLSKKLAEIIKKQ
ncbi:hypothetical protein OCC_03948 [Thermococcus litoralis DSM 5473]|uniref:Uncharacterized protein n=1 Tax=Thermococcus litoralis (strain ATCC 51850 / DSM 5473 / JCM 8560 / NS-C) TaxID=523849 RepID=H3ZQF1_THELN|nr:DUF6092 family protein [Thermococcus litoralis]EHR78174.1 hypothetical protein OCC_03948 [Thermococcus litoralis DSM 5473]